MKIIAAEPEDILLRKLRLLVGKRHVLSGIRKTRRFVRGFRAGGGQAAAVVRPGSLVEMWRVLELCVDARVIIVMQAANTGLTGGSVPDGADYDRPVVVVNTMRIDRIDILQEGLEVLCLPGATLYDLENRLGAVGRQPHSVIGSSCIGASVIGGIANNSGGALVQRGPAFTELALYARIGEHGQLELVNELEIDLGETPAEMMANLDAGTYRSLPRGPAKGSDTGYVARLRDVDAATPARYNANPENLKGASGSAGKLAIFAVRLDSFAKATEEGVYYIGTNEADQLAKLRRDILFGFDNLPVSAEYIHRDCFDTTRLYGKDTYWIIDRFGTRFMPTFFSMKARFDGVMGRTGRLGEYLSDRLLQLFAKCLPEQLPVSLRDFRDRYEHHLILKVADAGIAETHRYLEENMRPDVDSGWFRCDEAEAASAFLFRFSAAGAAMREAALKGDGSRLVALDIALPRNECDWFEQLPDELSGRCDKKIYYGHFLCHVFHQDYILKADADPRIFKADILQFMCQRNAEYPAEHNVGHAYIAKPELEHFYKTLDPTNSFNAGIGKTSKYFRYRCSPESCRSC